MTSEDLAARLFALEERLERLERLSFLSYTELRKVAEYAYQIRIYEPEPGDAPFKRMPKMHALSDEEALGAGMGVADLVALKFKMSRFLQARCRQDALALAKDIAEERKRRPIEAEEKGRSAA